MPADQNGGVVDEIGSAREQPIAVPVAARAPVAKKPKKPKSGLFWFLSLLISFGVCGLFPSTTLVMVVCMLPTAVVYLLDTHPRRHATKTIAWANLAGAMITALGLWGDERGIEAAVEILLSPFSWGMVLGAASIGWVIQYVVPRMVRGYLDISLKVQQKDTLNRQQTLEKEWGTDVRNQAPLDELDLLRAEIKALEQEAAEDAASNDESEKQEDAPEGASSTTLKS